jgi:hypothetical protein
VLQSEDESTEIKTTVTVTTDEHDHSNSEHWHQQFLDVIRVCKIKKDGDSEATGVGIFVSTDFSSLILRWALNMLVVNRLPNGTVRDHTEAATTTTVGSSTSLFSCPSPRTP